MMSCSRAVVLFGAVMIVFWGGLSAETDASAAPPTHHNAAPLDTAPLLPRALKDARRNIARFRKDPDFHYVWQRTRYIQVTVGNERRLYTRAGKRIRRTRLSTPGTVVAGNYAEVSWELLDKHCKIFSDQVGQYVVRREKNGWRQVASWNSEDGYDLLSTSGIPSYIIKRLQE